MLRIRVVDTAPGNKAVQVIYYKNRNRVVFKYIGSGKDQREIELLKNVTQDFINNYAPPLPLHDDLKSDKVLYVEKTEFLGVYYTFLYEALRGIFHQIGLSAVGDQLLLDLAVPRVVEPASKLRSVELMETYFGIRHRRQDYYKSAPRWHSLKDKIAAATIEFAKEKYDFDFDLLFYDVTTLYFETFQEDGFRNKGFSKDNKSRQPPILIALMVTKEGFPVAYDIFQGNTFEGHTIIPVVKDFIAKNKANEFTVVADAAMIGTKNIRALRKDRINYIVGARLRSLSDKPTDRINKETARENGKSIRVKTDHGYLVCSYSSVRYRKDKHEMEKQIERAKSVIDGPSKNKRLKFTKVNGKKLNLTKNLSVKPKNCSALKDIAPTWKKTSPTKKSRYA